MAEARLHQSPVGQLVKSWRQARRISQLVLSVQAGISPRHLSFIETGRSQPSRDMVLTIARTLDVPLRDTNALLLTAGFAPFYRETALDAPEMAHVRHVIEFLLERHEPFGAVALDRHWNILLANESFWQTLGLIGYTRRTSDVNLLRTLFDPAGLRSLIVNWEEVAYSLIQRVHREAIDTPAPSQTAMLLSELLETPGVPPRWRLFDIASVQPLMIPMRMRMKGVELSLFTTIATLGTPQDITLQELRIETFLPADADTERCIRALRTRPPLPERELHEPRA